MLTVPANTKTNRLSRGKGGDRKRLERGSRSETGVMMSDSGGRVKVKAREIPSLRRFSGDPAAISSQSLHALILPS